MVSDETLNLEVLVLEAHYLTKLIFLPRVKGDRCLSQTFDWNPFDFGTVKSWKTTVSHPRRSFNGVKNSIRKNTRATVFTPLLKVYCFDLSSGKDDSLMTIKISNRSLQQNVRGRR